MYEFDKRMIEIEKELSKIIDNEFSFEFTTTGNKLLDQSNKAKKISELTNTAIDKCIDLLNTKYPEQARLIVDSGFIGKYIKEKQKQLLLS